LKFEGEYLNGKMYEGKMYDTKFNTIFQIRKGKGDITEYDDYGDYKIYEGEYLNERKNGYGKEYYDNGGIKFEGIYINGTKWNGTGYTDKNESAFELIDGNGLVKEYYDNGKLQFEGEYLKGEKHGQGKEYYKNGKLKFEGEYLNGEKNGKGKGYYENGRIKF